MVETTGQITLRKENVDSTVKGFALQSYKFKNSLMIQSSNSWKETYFQEGSSELTGGTGSAVKGIPRNAAFPYGEPNWEEKSKRMEKYGMEGVVSWEDARTSEIDVIARTLLRIGRAVAKAVDDEIYSQITTNAGNTVTIAAGNEWDSSTVAKRDPIQNILDAIKEIETDNYDVSTGGELWLSPKDFANLMGNANVKNSGQFFTSNVTKNGRVGRMLGLTIVKSVSVTADEAIVIIAKEAATWKAAAPLTTVSITDPGIKTTIRAWEVGVTQVTNPKAICKISNTQK